MEEITRDLIPSSSTKAEIQFSIPPAHMKNLSNEEWENLQTIPPIFTGVIKCQFQQQMNSSPRLKTIQVRSTYPSNHLLLKKLKMDWTLMTPKNSINIRKSSLGIVNIQSMPRTFSINLIWSNAQTFNEEGSDIYDSATQLRLDCEQRTRSILPDGLLRVRAGEMDNHKRLHEYRSRTTSKLASNLVICFQRSTVGAEGGSDSLE